MKTYAGLSLLVIASCVAFGQDRPASAPPERSSDAQPVVTAATKELQKVARSDPIKTFAEAFLDPNVVIGVFEYSKEISTAGVPSAQMIEFLDGYWAAQEKYGIRMMHCVKAIKGEVPVSAVFVFDRLVPDQPEGRRIPSFVPVAESTWILALEKTTHKSRVARFGDEIDEYTFLEDSTFFRMFHYGYGALRLQLPQEDETASHESRRVQTVPETATDDFVGIRKVLPLARKDSPTVDDAATIGLAWRGMKTPMGKSILGEILATTPTK
jgi:hypothetical protein